MKKTIIILLLLASTLLGEYEKDVKIPSVTFTMAQDEDFKAIQRNCQWCHSHGYILNQGKQSREFWRKSVIKMREVYKAPITQKDEKIIIDYLFRHYGDNTEE
ncbi:hypothetical protein M947_05755 [Sulfurimonas hongkongensis]|uniref:Sulfite:cytochrome C oxidoreductase subunit B n=1 Tax=Sulfurimonas hongkongensis TaxID=1172190 RepID=T0KR15_9BACT|nr:hypothetical protein [Sulfurimonas hongkongensis]EQB39499.1 hypothetical protein M947_05755 [Sulfurimonas hongkongensis]